MSWRIGVDIGGTFTDVVLADEASGAAAVVKVPTTPRDFAGGVVEGLRAAMGTHGVAAGDVVWLAHATTVVTNALLAGQGARTALITTRGCRDVLELRRSARARLYDLHQDAPATLVPRHFRLEVSERVDAQGQVVIPLASADVDAAIEFVRAHQVEAIAVCLLFSFLNDTRAQLAATHRGITRLQELARKHGVPRLLAIMQAVLDYSERMMGGLLAALPDGTATFEDFCDGDGILDDGAAEDRPFWIRMRVDKRGDRLTVDFAGTDPQVPGPMNAPLNVTASGIYCAIKMIADPGDLVPPNSGCWRPISCWPSRERWSAPWRRRRSCTPTTRSAIACATCSSARWPGSPPTA